MNRNKFRLANNVWKVGMPIDPVHFQHSDQYFQSYIQTLVRSISNYNWGILKLVIDEKLLLDGIFSLEQCYGFLKDGLYFDIDLNFKEYVAPLQFTTPPRTGKYHIYLTIPRLKEKNVHLPSGSNGASKRFQEIKSELEDENESNRSPIEVELKSLNISLKEFEEEPSHSDFDLLKIAVLNFKNNSYELDPSFVPTSLTMQASDSLRRVALGILGQINSKADSLQSSLNNNSHTDLELPTLKQYGILAALKSHIPFLHHIVEYRKHVHPEVFYDRILSLISQLSAYLPPQSPDLALSIAPYNHSEIQLSYAELQTALTMILGGSLVGQKKIKRLPFTMISQERYDLRDIDDAFIRSPYDLYIGISAHGRILRHTDLEEIQDRLAISSHTNIMTIQRSGNPNKDPTALCISLKDQVPVTSEPQRPIHKLYIPPNTAHWGYITQSKSMGIFFRPLSEELNNTNLSFELILIES